VEILKLEPGPWGWTTLIPELGLLPDDFPDPYLKIFDLRRRATATVAPGVEVPIGPFLGTMGVHTDEPGEFIPFPPHKGGGNLDNRHLVTGSTLWLPVWCEGALFSCGDAHAAQGDGEVCVTGIECAMGATLRFNLQKRSLTTPSFRTPRAVVDPGPYHGTMGIHPELMEGARLAVRAMIDWLAAEHGLSREDAYVLCSLAGDLRIHEIVDAGVWNVGMTMPLGVFV
jgi:acetamidase/formamidase